MMTVSFGSQLEYHDACEMPRICHSVPPAMADSIVRVTEVLHGGLWVRCENGLFLPVSSASYYGVIDGQAPEEYLTFRAVDADARAVADGERHRLATMVSDQDSSKNRLLAIEPFVLDNSLRETAVAQVKGHTLQTKLAIWKLLQSAGLREFICACPVPSHRRVDDDFLAYLQDGGHDRGHMWVFSEIFGRGCYSDGHTVDDADWLRPGAALPHGVVVAKRYGVPNVIVEVDLLSAIAGLDGNEHALKVLLWIRSRECAEYLSTAACRGRVLINFRDWWGAWQENPSLVLRVIGFLSRRRAADRPFGLLYEDPSGAVLPLQVRRATEAMRSEMELNGWDEGHLLVHIHKNFGLADAAQLEALAGGATGIWCAVCDEGASTGHASSLLTLTNLARLGNEVVMSTHDFPALRRAAIGVTQQATGALPHSRSELCGDAAFDVIWNGGLTANMWSSVKVNELLGVKPNTRLSSLASANMFIDKLVEVFGGDAAHWVGKEDAENRSVEDSMGGRMKARMMEHLRGGDNKVVGEDDDGSNNNNSGANFNRPGELLKLWQDAGGQPKQAGEAVAAVAKGERLLGELRVFFDVLVRDTGGTPTDTSSVLPRWCFESRFLYSVSHDTALSRSVVEATFGTSTELRFRDVEKWALLAIEGHLREVHSLSELIRVMWHRTIVPAAMEA